MTGLSGPSFAGPSLAGKVVLITGGGSGMGRTHGLEFAARGATVAITDIDAAGAAETKTQIEAQGGHCIMRQADNADAAALQSAIASIESEAGRIDILINNAGVSGRSLPLEQITPELFDEMFAVHVRGAFFATQAVVAGMKSRRDGRIVNISSSFTMGIGNSASHYTAAKSALSGLTKSWAREFAPWGITVNAIAPGLIDTPMTRGSIGAARIAELGSEIPLRGRTATQQEISFAAMWLAGPEAAMMTGQVISPNGGVAIVGI
jgi:3-oxoacyl-[acyl-carrier protein] reductase